MPKNSISLRAFLAAYLTLGIASWVGAGVGLYNMLNSSGSPSQTQQSGPNGASMGWLNQGVNNSQNLYNQLNPSWLQSFQGQSNIPTGGLIDAGNAAGKNYADLSGYANAAQRLLWGQAGTTMGAQQNLMGAGNQLWQTAQDPQNALYDRTLGRVQDQSRAASSARGIGMSGEAAGLENQATGNFNIDWNNNQLSRMLAGSQGMNQAYAGAGQQNQLTGANLAGSMNYGQQQPMYEMAAFTTPIQAQMMAYGLPGQAANNYFGSAQQANVSPYFQAAGMGGTQSSTYQPYGAQASNMNALLTGSRGIQDQYNQPGSWLSNIFGGGGGQQQPYQGYAMGGAGGMGDQWSFL